MTTDLFPAPPGLSYVATINVEVDAPIKIGETADGQRQVVPIRGGRVSGPRINGSVLNAGADFQRYPSSDVALLQANYVLQLDEGTKMLVENCALRTAPAEVLQALMSGQEVDPQTVYFRCAPRLSVDETSPYSWVNRRLFIGTGERHPNGVRIHVFSVE